MWQIELARAYSSEKQKRKEVEDSLEAVMVEARHLSGQVEYLSRCQWPREMALWPPERRRIRSNVIKELESGTLRSGKRRKTPTPGQGSAADADTQQSLEDSDAEDKPWDYDSLVSKWKKVVREDAVRKRSLTLPAPSYTPPVPTSAKSGNMTMGHPTPHAYNTSNTPTSSTTHSSAAAAAAAAAPPPPLPTTTSTGPTKKEDTNQYFEPWCKKPRLVMEESNDCIMDAPRSNPHQQQQQQRTQSNSRDGIAEASGQRNGILSHQKQQQQQQQGHYDGNGGGGGFAFGNGNGNGDGNKDGEGAVDGRNGDE
jgi:hypothetical protein